MTTKMSDRQRINARLNEAEKQMQSAIAVLVGLKFGVKALGWSALGLSIETVLVHARNSRDLCRTIAAPISKG